MCVRRRRRVGHRPDGAQWSGTRVARSTSRSGSTITTRSYFFNYPCKLISNTHHNGPVIPFALQNKTLSPAANEQPATKRTETKHHRVRFENRFIKKTKHWHTTRTTNCEKKNKTQHHHGQLEKLERTKRKVIRNLKA